MNHFLQNGLIDPNHYGFLPRRSVAGCQNHFLTSIANAQNDGNAIVAIYLDIRRAFDQVPHHALLDKLRASGIRNRLLTWLRSYLTGRTQTTIVSGYASSPISISSGVVQGSVLGPTLFLLYINDIMKSIQHGTPFLFADDVKIVYAFRPSLTDIYVQRIQEDLDSLTLWSRYSGLSFSAQKCQLMAYRCHLAEHAIKLCNSRIPLVSYTNDLGIRYTCHFEFSTQALHQVA